MRIWLTVMTLILATVANSQEWNWQTSKYQKGQIVVKDRHGQNVTVALNDTAGKSVATTPPMIVVKGEGGLKDLVENAEMAFPYPGFVVIVSEGQEFTVERSYFDEHFTYDVYTTVPQTVGATFHPGSVCPGAYDGDSYCYNWLGLTELYTVVSGSHFCDKVGRLNIKNGQNGASLRSNVIGWPPYSQQTYDKNDFYTWQYKHSFYDDYWITVDPVVEVWVTNPCTHSAGFNYGPRKVIKSSCTVSVFSKTDGLIFLNTATEQSVQGDLGATFYNDDSWTTDNEDILPCKESGFMYTTGPAGKSIVGFDYSSNGNTAYNDQMKMIWVDQDGSRTDLNMPWSYYGGAPSSSTGTIYWTDHPTYEAVQVSLSSGVRKVRFINAGTKEVTAVDYSGGWDQEWFENIASIPPP